MQPHKNLCWHRCRVSTFRVPHSAHQTILAIENSKLRASAYKLYRWMLSVADRNPGFWAQSQDIQTATGLCENAIIRARKELLRLSLIQATLEPGPSGRYYFTVMNPQQPFFPLDWTRRPWPRYFRVPYLPFPIVNTLKCYALPQTARIR